MYLQSKSIEKPLIRGKDSSKFTFRLSSSSASIDTGAGATAAGISTTDAGSKEAAGSGQGTVKFGAEATVNGAAMAVVTSVDDDDSI